MPIYEFHCEACRRDFEALVPRVDAVAPCPGCGSEDVRKAISCPARPVSTGSTRGAEAPPPCASGGG